MTFQSLGEALAIAYKGVLPDMQFEVVQTAGSVSNVQKLEMGEAELGLALADVAYMGTTGMSQNWRGGPPMSAQSPFFIPRRFTCWSPAHPPSSHCPICEVTGLAWARLEAEQRSRQQSCFGHMAFRPATFGSRRCRSWMRSTH